MDAILMVLLKKVVDVVGGEAASALKSATRRRAEYALFHGLRSLEETLDRSPHIISLAADHAKNRERRHYRFAHEEIQSFVSDLISALDKTQSAFDLMQTKIEIYGSREIRDRLERLLGADAQVMYLFQENYNNTRATEAQWMELFSALSVERTHVPQ